jgi:hypothetical protein
MGDCHFGDKQKFLEKTPLPDAKGKPKQAEGAKC